MPLHERCYLSNRQLNCVFDNLSRLTLNLFQFNIQFSTFDTPGIYLTYMFVCTDNCVMRRARRESRLILLFALLKRKRQSRALLTRCEGNPPVTGGFPSQRVSNAHNVSTKPGGVNYIVCLYCIIIRLALFEPVHGWSSPQGGSAAGISLY